MFFKVSHKSENSSQRLLRPCVSKNREHKESLRISRLWLHVVVPCEHGAARRCVCVTLLGCSDSEQKTRISRGSSPLSTPTSTITHDTLSMVSIFLSNNSFLSWWNNSLSLWCVKIEDNNLLRWERTTTETGQVESVLFFFFFIV